MINANENDKSLVADILTSAFLHNKSVNYLIPQDGLKMFRIHELMQYSFEICLLFGEVFLCDDRKGCVLLLYPELKRTTFRSVWLDLKLIFKGIGFRNMFKAIKRESRINAVRPDQRMAYIWFIGVMPEYQHFGLGKRLIEEVIIKTASDDRKIFLETSTIENLPWYRKFGFEVYEELTFGYTLFFLKR
ncbi:GNAT family N-acetyltransferase [Pedobacter sp. Du54]|uniref:GNAT family N-acetyltransferase n=1 Tax=Pedobacter anseongensis TaxID=3133439 RepID=UPI0030B1617B